MVIYDNRLEPISEEFIKSWLSKNVDKWVEIKEGKVRDSSHS